MGGGGLATARAYRVSWRDFQERERERQTEMELALHWGCCVTRQMAARSHRPNHAHRGIQGSFPLTYLIHAWPNHTVNWLVESATRWSYRLHAVCLISEVCLKATVTLTTPQLGPTDRASGCLRAQQIDLASVSGPTELVPPEDRDRIQSLKSCFIHTERRWIMSRFVIVIYHRHIPTDLMKNGVFWDVTPCGSCKNRSFGWT
jgi:hypothetical protein